MEKRQRHPLPGVCEDDTCQHGPSPTTGTFRLCLLLAVHGRQLLIMVHFGTECQGLFGIHRESIDDNLSVLHIIQSYIKDTNRFSQ